MLLFGRLPSVVQNLMGADDLSICAGATEGVFYCLKYQNNLLKMVDEAFCKGFNCTSMVLKVS